MIAGALLAAHRSLDLGIGLVVSGCRIFVDLAGPRSSCSPSESPIVGFGDRKFKINQVFVEFLQGNQEAK